MGRAKRGFGHEGLRQPALRATLIAATCRQMASPPVPDKSAPDKPDAGAPGVATRAAALRLLDGVLRRGLPLEGMLDKATRSLDRSEDRALAHAIVGAVLRHLPDLDTAIDGATRSRIADDAKGYGITL